MFTFTACPHGLNTHCMAFLPGDAPLLATLGEDGARVWDLRERTAVRRLDDIGAHPASISPSPDGRLLAVCADEGPATIRLWDWRAGRVEANLPGGDKVQCAVFSPDGRTLAFGGYREGRSGMDYSVRRLRAPGWKPQRLLRGHEDQTGFLAFSPDGRMLATGAADQSVILWGLSSREPLASVGHPTLVWGVAFSPDGRLLATTGGKTVKLFDVARLKPIRRQLSGHKKEVRGIAFSPDGATLASVALDGMVRLWDLPSRKARRVLDWGLGPLHCIGFSHDGMLAAAGAADGRVVVWDRDE